MKKPGKSAFNLKIIALVKDLREKKGLSQEDIARFIEVERAYVGQIESPHNIAKYNIDHLNRIAFELGCSVHDLIPSKPIDEKIVSIRRKPRKKKK